MEENRNGGKKYPDKVGVLTFHCSDNFGAMLQTYGTLSWLTNEGFDAFVVNYVPAFLRGREWLIPYVPAKRLGLWLAITLGLFRRNMRAGMAWWERRRRMSAFRREYLTHGDKAIRRLKGLSKVGADLLVVGSDQIWNPGITFGFCPAYFGAFENSRVRKTIAYAASFGTASLPEGTETEFAGLLASVGDISMREKGAAEYIQTRFHREACHVVDPVFLLSAGEWQAIADRPKESGYVLYYEMERNEQLRDAASRFAKEKGLEVIVIGLSGGGRSWKRWQFRTACGAGPAQFLGYISAAGYVFTNSFHGLSFSILLHKPFYIHNHGTVGARIESLLTSTGLTGRMAVEGYAPDMEGEIDWMEVDRRLGVQREQSVEFLRRSLTS